MIRANAWSIRQFIQRHSLLISQAFNIFQRFSPTYTYNIVTTKNKKEKKQEQTRTSTLATYQVNLIIRQHVSAHSITPFRILSQVTKTPPPVK